MEKDKLLKTLTVLDFMATDLNLYLNTHPCDEEAIATYNSIIEKANTYRKTYEEKYGPLSSYRSPNYKNNWMWPEDPWPWQEKFNVKCI